MKAMPRLADAMGSPARAGIDPASGVTWVPCVGFPRTRGDRPFDDVVLRLTKRVPPHARG